MLSFDFRHIQQRLEHFWDQFLANLFAERIFTSEIRSKWVGDDIHDRVFYCYCVSLFQNASTGHDLFARLGGWESFIKLNNNEISKCTTSLFVSRIGIDSHRTDLIKTLQNSESEINNRLIGYKTAVLNSGGQSNLVGLRTNQSFESIYHSLRAFKIFQTRIKRFDFLEIVVKHNHFYITPSLLHTLGSTGPIRGLAMILFGTTLWPKSQNVNGSIHCLNAIAYNINISQWNAFVSNPYYLSNSMTEEEKIEVIEKWLIAETRKRFSYVSMDHEFVFAVESAVCNFQKSSFFASNFFPSLYQD